MGRNRMEAFSDGVLAIVITIMVLEMKVPHGVSWDALRPLVPVFLSYVLSFLYVGIYWNNHHHLLHSTQRVSGGILWANLHLLFWLSLFPFTTGWMGENHLAPIPTAVYGFVLLMAAIAYWLLQRAIIRQQGQPSLLAEAVGRDWKGKLSPVLYFAAIPLAFVSVWIAVGLYVLVALLWLIPDRRIERVLAGHPVLVAGAMGLGVVGGSAGEPGVTGVGTQSVNVLVIQFDPVLRTRGNRKLHEAFQWSDPRRLTRRMVEDARECSGGYVDYRVVETLEYDGFPQFRDGYRYTEEEFLAMWEKDRTQARPAMTSFVWLFNEFDLARKIRELDLREIWLWGAPYMNWDELHWKTPGDRVPYPTGNPWFYRPYDIPDVGRTVWIMGWNYERGEGEMLESYCHRIESVLSLTVGRGAWDPVREKDNLWNRFTRVDKDYPGESEVGSVHYAPNSATDYDWGNTNAVWTYADDWLSYPDLPRKKKRLNAATGGWEGITGHHLWWMRRLPRAAGVTEGFYNNWWEYVVNYDEALRRLPPPGATFQKPAQAQYGE